MDVFAVFLVTGDADGSAVHDLQGIAKTPQAASAFVRDQFDDADAERDLVHDSMNRTNNFTFHGPRDKTRPYCGFGAFGGYIVEAMPLIDAVPPQGPHFAVEKVNVRTVHAKRQ